MATTKETLKTFRERFNVEAEEAFGDHTEAMGCFDRALASVLMDQMDGAAPEPKKRSYTRKPKQNTSSPATE